MEIATNVYRFETGPFNWYVVREGRELTLVDAGFPGHYEVLVNGLSSIGQSVADVKCVLLTHAHADHMGFAERVRREANCPVFVHSKDKVAAGRSLQLPWFGLLSNVWRPFVASILTHATFNSVFIAPRIQVLQAIDGGDQLDVPGSPRVIHVPGHTPGEVAYYFPKSNVTITGDSIVTLNLFTGECGGPQLPHRLLNADDKRSRSSLDKLTDLGQTTILPGHGLLWHGNLEEAIASARKAEPENL